MKTNARSWLSSWVFFLLSTFAIPIAVTAIQAEAATSHTTIEAVSGAGRTPTRPLPRPRPSDVPALQAPTPPPHTAVVETATWAAWVTATATLLGVIVALIGVWWQLRRQWLLNSATAVTALTDRFTSEEWRAYRAHCAAVIQLNDSGEPVDLAKDFPILGFFETMGHLVRRGILDEQMIWNKFGWYIVRYHLALSSDRNLIEANRRSENDDTLWEEFDWLNRRMLRIYSRKSVNIAGPELRRQRVDELLQQELNLTHFLDPALRPIIIRRS
jgi:hypothetical protein